MSKKGHLISFPESTAPANWVTPTSVVADCGEKIPDAKPILRAESIEEMIELVRQGKRTSYFCGDCFLKALIPRNEKYWLFLIAEKEFADRLNAGQGEDQ